MLLVVKLMCTIITTGTRNVVVGRNSLDANTGGDNELGSIGAYTGSDNTALDQMRLG